VMSCGAEVEVVVVFVVVPDEVVEEPVLEN
jgi:hypothetical protein